MVWYFQISGLMKKDRGWSGWIIIDSLLIGPFFTWGWVSLAGRDRRFATR
jgi:hypothetical protein